MLPASAGFRRASGGIHSAVFMRRAHPTALIPPLERHAPPNGYQSVGL
jgi:hypothetical protein